MFPKVLGSWQGHDFLIDSRIVDGLALDDYLNRLYENDSGEELGLYVGYYKSQRNGITIHSPKNCLPGAGWQPIISGYAELTQTDGQRVPVNMYLIQKGISRQVVLYWYESHGRIVASEYWAKIYMVLDAIRLNRTDAALVRVVTPVDQNGKFARQRAIKFAEQVSAELGAFIQ
jgi:EpsI family protein